MATTVVGITCDIKGKLFESEKFYSEKVLQAGAIPFYLPMTTSSKHVMSIVGEIDAIIISGSRDIDPALYGQKKTKTINPLDAARTTSEILYINSMKRKRKKILGICGGMQLINVCFGGTLLQDIESIVSKPLNHKDGASHEIVIQRKSLLSKIIKKKKVRVKSYHHQAVDEIPPSFMPCAESSDRIVEGIESLDGNVLGVQWHPELSNSIADSNIFRWLVRKK